MRSGSEVFPVADADERPALRYDVQGAAAGDGLATGVNGHVDDPRSPIAHDGHQIRLPQVDRPPSQSLGQGQVIGRDRPRGPAHQPQAATSPGQPRPGRPVPPPSPGAMRCPDGRVARRSSVAAMASCAPCGTASTAWPSRPDRRPTRPTDSASYPRLGRSHADPCRGLAVPVNHLRRRPRIGTGLLTSAHLNDTRGVVSTLSSADHSRVDRAPGRS